MWKVYADVTKVTFTLKAHLGWPSAVRAVSETRRSGFRLPSPNFAPSGLAGMAS